MEVIKSNIYLPPEEDYEMDVADDKEDEAMKEMLQGQTMRIILKKLKNDVIAEEKDKDKAYFG